MARHKERKQHETTHKPVIKYLPTDQHLTYTRAVVINLILLRMATQ